MTDPLDGRESGSEEAPLDPARAETGPPGARTFGLEGRAAPGLYLVAWLLTIVGSGTIGVALLSGGAEAAAALVLIGSLVLALGLLAGAGSQTLERRRLPVEVEREAGSAEAGLRPTDRPYRGPSPFLAFAASLPITVLIVGVVIGPIVGLGVPLTSPIATLLSVLLTALVYVGLVRFLVVGTGALSWAEMGLRRLDGSAAREFLAGAVLAAPVILVTALLAEALVRVVGTAPDSPLPAATDVPGLVANLIAAAIVAPIGEELFFRGYATTAWARGMGERRGLVRGAIFFALIHVLAIGGSSFGDAFGRVIVAFVGRLPVSIALGWVFLRRRSLYAAIGLHATFNAALVVLAEVASRALTP